MANDENDDEMMYRLLDTSPYLEFKRMVHMVVFARVLSIRHLEASARLKAEAD